MVDQIQEQISASDHVEALRHRVERVSWNWVIPVGLALVFTVVIATAAILFVVFVGAQSNTAALATQEQPVAAPADSTVQQEPETAIEPVAKVWPTREATWEYIGQARRNREEIAKLQLPESRTSFISGPALKAEWSFFTEHAHGYAEGNTGCALVSEKEALYCTPDHGQSWFRVPNLYPGKSLTPAELVGAVHEKDALVSYLELQVKPWVFSYWRAEFR